MAKIPGYRKHKASGRAVVTLAGRDYYLGQHGTPESKREYKRLVGEYLASDPSAFGKPKDSLTIVEVMAGYLSHCRKHYGERSRDELQRIKLALRPVKQVYATNLAAEFGPLQFKAIRESVTRDQCQTPSETATGNPVRHRVLPSSDRTRLRESQYRTLGTKQTKARDRNQDSQRVWA